MSQLAPSEPQSADHRLAHAIALVRRARTSAEVLAGVPRAALELGFDRVMFSTVDEEYWRPQAVQIGSDSRWSARLLDAAVELPQPIELSVPEKRVIDKLFPVIVPPPRDVHAWSKQTWNYQHPRRVTSYTAAPIVAGGRAIGIIHADRGIACAPLAGHHAAILWAFCGVVELALEALTAQERLLQMRTHLGALVQLSNGQSSAPATQGGGPRTMPEMPTAAPLALAADAELTARERQTLELIAQGLSNADIAEHLVVTEGTIKAHVKHILAKTRSSNRTAAALKWMRREIV